MKKKMSIAAERAAALQPTGEQIQASLSIATAKSSKIVARDSPRQHPVCEKQSFATADQCQFRPQLKSEVKALPFTSLNVRVKNTFLEVDIPDVDGDDQS